jgi:uncharacterized protein (DUF1800 family)
MALADPRAPLAYNRFGLGPRPGDLGRAGDVRAALLAELDAPPILDDPALQRTAQIIQSVFDDQERKKAERERLGPVAAATPAIPAAAAAPALPAAARPKVTAFAFETPMRRPAPPAPPPPPAPAIGPPAPPPATPVAAPAAAMAAPPKPPSPEQLVFRAEAVARLARAGAAPIGFRERLVAFWSNHFCVSAAKSNIGRGCAGAFEREAIRPHVTGRFADMLLAVEQHPAMLNFLDNAQSIGPDSKAGQNRKRGLNENLAREILELHTMGVGSGYSQADVTQLAQIITGWTIVGREGRLGEPGTFVFNPNAHQPGSAIVLGRSYAPGGLAQGEAALRDIARHPAVATHIAKKFARHFVADQPDPGLVGRLAKTFRDTDGDCGALARALIEDEAAWSAPPTKIRNPWEVVVAVQRAFNRPAADPGPTLNAMNLLGMPLWQPSGPNGFSDETAAWASPEGMKMRLELAAQFARQLKDAPSPADLVDQILGPAASAPTRQAVARAESGEQALALLIMSPEFQRR